MYAPGLPSKTSFPSIRAVKKPEQWPFVIQEHQADRAGHHFDLRLGDQNSKNGHSFALRYLPNPGEKRLAVRQPDHTLEYFDFEGKIEKGYGKGTVKQHSKGTADVVESSDSLIKFVTHEGRRSNEYTLVRIEGSNWILINKGEHRLPPSLLPKKLKIKDKKWDQIDVNDESKVLTAKIDGGSSTVLLQPGKQIRAFSPRRRKNGSNLIEYTHKIPEMPGTKASKQDGVTKLLGEVHVEAEKPATVGVVGGMLNASVPNSRELQKKHGPLKISLFDVHIHKGKDVRGLHYKEKLPILHRIAKNYPKIFTIPEYAVTSNDKKRMISAIQSKRHRQTEEGVVEWDQKPVKIKSNDISDVWVVGVVPGKGKYAKSGGALLYSNSKDGPPVGKVGSGFSDSQRLEMVTRPESFLRRRIVVRHLPSGGGALRAATFLGVHGT